MLRITNNRKKAEMSMGLKISPDELASALSGNSRNIRLEKLLSSWTSQIKGLMMELTDRKEADKDAKEIRLILQERLLGEDGHCFLFGEVLTECFQQNVVVYGDGPVVGAFSEDILSMKMRVFSSTTIP